MAYRVKVGDKYVKGFEKLTHLVSHIDGFCVHRATDYTDDIEQATKVSRTVAELLAKDSGGVMEGIRGRTKLIDGGYSRKRAEQDMSVLP